MSIRCFVVALALNCRFDWLNMDPDNTLHKNEIWPKVEEDAYFDKSQFLSANMPKNMMSIYAGP